MPCTRLSEQCTSMWQLDKPPLDRDTLALEEGRVKVIATEGMDLFHIADGRIQQINAYLDRLSSLVEMGVISPPAQI